MSLSHVSPPGPRLSRRASSTTSSAIRDLLEQATRPGVISLAGGLPDATLFPIEELADLVPALLHNDGRRILQYGPTEGTEECRALLGAHFALTDPDELLITTGSQQGLDLLARTLFDPGDVVITCDPEYLGARQAFAAHGAVAVPIPIDDDGLATSVLESKLRAGLRPKACYLVPHFHNPTGITISRERRTHLHHLSTTYGFVVIEDDPYRDLYFGSDPPTESQADPDWTVRLRSTSKILSPGLRVGVMSAPAPLRQAMVVAKQGSDLHTSTLSQAVAAAAVGAQWFEPQLQRLRDRYRVKAAALVEALLASFGPRIVVRRPMGGMFLWANFGPGVDTTQWLARSLEHGVCFVPGAAFAVEADLSSWARLSFATAGLDELTEAVDRMAAT